MNLCEYGCGQIAKYKLKNGKWCCSNHVNKCLAIRKKIIGIIKLKPILIETTELCSYECGQQAKYKFKNGKLCCSDHLSKCPTAIKKLNDSHKLTSIETTELCSYGCEQVAKYKLKNGKLCCNDHVNKCSINRKKSKIENKSILIETTELCSYGCGLIAKYKFKNGKLCCSDNINKCISFKKKNSKLKKGLLNPSKRLDVKIKLSNAAKKRLNMFGETNPAKRLDVRLKLSGINNPNWRGGIDCDPYCDAWADPEYKESIKKRDGYKCINPICKKISNNICIHHIDYNKKNCKPNNLITVCFSCNSVANFDREWYKSWYNAIILRRNY